MLSQEWLVRETIPCPWVLGHSLAPYASKAVLPLGFNPEAEYSCLCGLVGVFFGLRADNS